VAAKPETTFIASVHKHLPPTLYRVKNNNEYTAGIADVWYSGVSDLWVEYKFIAVPKRPETRIDLLTGKNPAISYLQQEWLRSRHGEGRSVGVIVGSKDGGVWLPGVAWEQPFTAKDFLAHLRTRKDLADTIVKETQQHG
jgi:hypothetical protein